MKIALIVPGGVDRSGEYRVIPVVLALMKRLAERHEVHVFALTQEPVPGEWMLVGAHVHNIGVKRTRRRAVIAVLREHRAKRFNVIHSIWSGSCGLVAVAAAKMLGIPSVVHIGGGELIALPDIEYGGLSWKARLREAMVLRAAACITAASAPILAELSGLGLSGRRVPLGIDLNQWPLQRPVRRAPLEPARLIHVASLNPIKDQGTLLRAIASLSELDFHLDVVGEDTRRGEIQALALTLGVADRVTFHGFLTQKQLRPLVIAAHLLIMSSRHETGPVVVLEAGAVGVPTIGTAVGHIADWSPSASVSVPVSDWRALGAAIRHLLLDEDRRVQIAAAAFKRATGEDADYTARQVEDIYRELTSAA
jgi:glycosyltransferase involved in cell wall biosynthesis